MYNFRSSVKRCYLFGSKIVINWLLLTSNILLINCFSNTTDSVSQTLSYGVRSNATEHTTQSFESNSIAAQIKQMLNVHPSNKSIDDIIRNTFNIDNPNPMYIFVLPDGERNRTLVLTRNNFDEAVYPNITIGQRFVRDDRRSNKLLQLLYSGANKDKSKEFDVDNAIFDLKDLDESESMRIVAENVRTERNFISFMERLNENGNNIDSGNVLRKNLQLKKPVDVSTTVNKEYEDLVSPKLKYKFQIDYSADLLKPTTQNAYRATKINWEDLGLEGWIGGLREPGKSFDTIVTE